ncbi:MAG: anaerobic ribonucleoside-triphosphate reductase activating protein [Bacteroidaceae bacterium]|nr:anaerobic ribonucleoside-triphosphate reductase activating protein [Bacteroidaceae bacterium]
MLKFHNYDIVFQEIPDETTLALNISGCPNHCPSCHSPHLQADEGTPLTTENLDLLLRQYEGLITCLCFMGGDAEPEMVNRFAAYIRSAYPTLKTGWYSGAEKISEAIDMSNFDYIKIGPYIESCGSLKSKTTNQRLYHILPSGKLDDITSRFWRT